MFNLLFVFATINPCDANQLICARQTRRPYSELRKAEAFKAAEYPQILCSLQPQSLLCIRKPSLTNLVRKKKKTMLKRKQEVFVKLLALKIKACKTNCFSKLGTNKAYSNVFMKEVCKNTDKI